MARSEQRGSPVDLNAADLDALKRIEGLDEEQARRILEHRERYGPFTHWEELEDVVGMGPVLAERVRAGAVLGAVRGEGAEGGEEELAWDEIEVDMDEVEVLTSLARLDLEVAFAFEVGAEAAEGMGDLKQHLQRFRDEHMHHVSELNRLLGARGARTVEVADHVGHSLLLRLARMSIPFGPIGLVLGLLNNEQMTNATYELALEFEWDEDTLRVLTHHATDEQRHLFWLAQTEDELSSDEETPAPLF